MSLPTGRRLSSARLEPNRAARQMLRTHYAVLATPNDEDEKEEPEEILIPSNKVI